MSYQRSVTLCLEKPNENQLIRLIMQPIDSEEILIKAKEQAICGLAQFYVDAGTPEKIKQIPLNFNQYFVVFSKPRLAKIIKNLVDYIGKVKKSEKLQIELCQYLVDWCVKQKRNYLKHRIQMKLGGLYLEVQQPSMSLKIIQPILVEVRKADDKQLLVELYLLESKINYYIKNYAKAKASLTASRANANNVYCQPAIMAEIDLMSGILYAHDQDYKTSYSYFYQALEPLISGKDSRAINCFKYMVMCKIMNNNKEDVNNLFNGKFGLKYAGNSHIEAMKAVASAHFGSSIVALSKVFVEFKQEIEEDQVIKVHTKILYEKLLEKNLFKIIDSYTRVDIAYIANKLSLQTQNIQRKLSEMILDKKIMGTLDQSNGCVIIYHEQQQQKLYTNSALVIDNLLNVIDKLNEASKMLKKTH